MVYLFSQIGKQSIFVCLSTVRTATKPVGVGWCEVSDALFFCVLRTLSAASAFQLMNYSRAMYPAPVCFPLVVCVMLIYPFSMLQVSVMLSTCVCATRANFSKCPFGELHSLFASPVALTPPSAENDGSRYVFIYFEMCTSLWMPICII